MPSRTVAVVVVTRGRSEGCARVVREVLGQELPSHWQLRVIVVDNNDVRQDLKLDVDDRVVTVYEPEPGIPDARNHGVAAALPHADVIAFIDDDEVPASPTWLASLIGPIESQEADVTTGLVRSRFPHGTPAWIRSQAVFNRREHASGTRLRQAYTNNVAIRNEIFREQPDWFDVDFRRTGGSDTEFFRRLRRHGARIVWVADAEVLEYVPRERATASWVLARSRRVGANRLQFLRAASSSNTRYLIYALASVTELMLGLAAPVLYPMSKRLALRCAARAARGLGYLSALIGIRVRPYPE